jgi:hypothetical protein
LRRIHPKVTLETPRPATAAKLLTACANGGIISPVAIGAVSDRRHLIERIPMTLSIVVLKVSLAAGFGLVILALL